MPIDVTCSNCSKEYRVREESAGRRFACRDCGAVITVPDASGPPADADAPPRPARPSSAGSKPAGGSSSRGNASGTSDKPAAPRKAADTKPSASRNRPSTGGTAASAAARAASSNPKRRKPVKKSEEFEDYEEWDDDAGGGNDDYGYDDYDEDAYDEYEPAPKKRSSGSSRKSSATKKKKKKTSSGGSVFGGFGFNINRLNVVLIALGVMGLIFGVKESKLRALSKSTPTQMTLTELIANGPGDNIYLTLTGFQPDLDETVVYGDEKPGGEISNYDKVWMPCRDAANPGAGTCIILYSTRSKDDMSVAALAANNTHTGMIVNEVQSIGRQERELLVTAFPGTNLDTVYIFHERRTPSGAGMMFLCFGGGIVAVLAGLAWVFFVPADQ